MGFERQIATARRLIKAKGQACLWRKLAAHDTSGDPWRDVRTGDPTDYPCSLVWFAPRDIARGREESLSSVAGRTVDVPTGHEIGLLAADGFEPLPGDVIVRGTDPDGVETAIVSLDKLAPDGNGILYFVKVKV